MLAADARYAGQNGKVHHHRLTTASGRPFYNTSQLDFEKLLDDPNHLAQNLNGYIRGFSENVREIINRFGFVEHIARMDEKNLLFEVIKRFAAVDLSPDRIDNMQMGYVFEELIRIGAENANEEAGEHFTPREIIGLMVNLLLSPEPDLGSGYKVKAIYDPACGTGGMLSIAEKHLREHNIQSRPLLYGQDHNDESWAVCKSDMLIKGENSDNIILGDTFTQDGYKHQSDGKPWRFDYMLANPPFGVDWKQQKRFIERERDTLGYDGRFGAGTPRIDDGAMLFLQHMLSKMEPVNEEGEGGTRIAIVFSGSPMFSGDAGSGTNSIRRWIIENDWLEAIVALPDQLFYNTGIFTFVWILTNRKEPRRVGKVQLIDGRRFFKKMRKSLNNKRNELSEENIADLTRIHGNFLDGETRDFIDEDPITHQPRTRTLVVSKVFSNDDFGYHKITVERPLRLSFAATPERIARIEEQTPFKNLAKSNKRPGPARDKQVATGKARQEQIRQLLEEILEKTDSAVMRDREAFVAMLAEEAENAGLRLYADQRKAAILALGQKDPRAEMCYDPKGNPEPDPELRDFENVPLAEDIDEYMEREVLPYKPDAWVDYAKTKLGYEIPFGKHFYTYEPPRPLDEIAIDLRTLENDIVQLTERLEEYRTALVTRTVTKGLPPEAAREAGLDPNFRYRDSGVEWVGKVPEHWEMRRLVRSVSRVLSQG